MTDVPALGQPVLRTMGLSRGYPGVQALSEVDFDLLPGEVHCLVGENGAGKSTLMRLLSGAEQPESGMIEIDGKLHTGLRASQALSLGISEIYQERDLLPHLSAAKNIFLGHQPKVVGVFLSRRRMREQAGRLFQHMGVRLDPNILVGALSQSDQQFVQIARALSRPCRVLIMDEPGAVLRPHELESLFAVVRELVAAGRGVIYISHRLDEVRQIGNRVSVMRQGRLVATLSAQKATASQLADLMVGRELDYRLPGPGDNRGDRDRPVVLSVSNLRWRRKVNDVSFDLHEGEILGLAGFVGAGRSETLGCIAGTLKLDGGQIRMGSRLLHHRSPRDAVRNGIGLVPEDRRESGLLLGRPLSDNVVLASLQQFTRFGVLDHKKVAAVAERFKERLRIMAPSVKTEVGFLSGGNQQKVVLARWLASGVRVLLLDEPTRGVDVGDASRNLLAR